MRSTRPLIPASVAAALIVAGLTGAAVAQGKGMRAAGCGPDPERVQRMFDRLDADGDGRITAEEAAAAPQRRFAAVDSDGDGKVSAEEMVERRMTMMRARVESHVAAMIAEMDDDGDGMLTAEEMGPGRRAERRAEKRHARMFEMMDADDDGVVSREEAQAGAAKMAERGSRGYGRGPGREGRPGMMHHGMGGHHGGGHHDMHKRMGSGGMGMGPGGAMGDCPMLDDAEDE